VIARGPTQEPNCRVTFVLEMQECHFRSSCQQRSIGTEIYLYRACSFPKSEGVALVLLMQEGAVPMHVDPAKVWWPFCSFHLFTYATSVSVQKCGDATVDPS
jgi:hypothetical protein